MADSADAPVIASFEAFDVVEADIAALRAALDRGATTSVELVAAYLERVARFDRSGASLNSIPQLSSSVFSAARASDRRRAAGAPLSPLDGIPYTVKDSYAVRGQSLAAGSPAFRDLTARDDAFTVSRLRSAGAVCLGRTTMPPMANGGMQRGLYGRAESPYNADYLTAAFASGSSNGSGSATAASLCSFGLGEETWSSGRAPASNNALVAYTPSRGVISVRGNWPLVPTMDVVVPHTRSVADLLEVLDVIVADDPDVAGDLWREQTWHRLPAASQVRPRSYVALDDSDALKGVRLGVPRMYINRDDRATNPIPTRASVIDLWGEARKDLQALGAEVVEVDFPVVSNYERDRPGASSMVDRGLVSSRFLESELWDLAMIWWDRFLRDFGASGPRGLADVDGPLIFPQATGSLPDRYGDGDFDVAQYPVRARRGLPDWERIPDIESSLRGLEETRVRDFEQWMSAEGLDGVVFPAVADVAPADADVNPQSADLAWRNGTWVANGNLVPRHLGIPTVTVPMGVMSDLGMPVGLTFAGAAYSDTDLLRRASRFARFADRRVPPPRTTPGREEHPQASRGTAGATVDAAVRVVADELGEGVLEISVHVIGDVPLEALRLTADGELLEARLTSDRVATARHVRPPRSPHSQWRPPYGSMIVAIATFADGTVDAAFVTTGPERGVEHDDVAG